MGEGNEGGDGLEIGEGGVAEGAEDEEREDSEGEEVEALKDIEWGPSISKKRKEREDFWIDAELRVRQVCGYKERRSKKVNRRTKELEEGRSQDIRDMFGQAPEVEEVTVSSPPPRVTEWLPVLPARVILTLPPSVLTAEASTVATVLV